MRLNIILFVEMGTRVRVHVPGHVLCVVYCFVNQPKVAISLSRSLSCFARGRSLAFDVASPLAARQRSVLRKSCLYPPALSVWPSSRDPQMFACGLIVGLPAELLLLLQARRSCLDQSSGCQLCTLHRTCGPFLGSLWNSTVLQTHYLVSQTIRRQPF